MKPAFPKLLNTLRHLLDFRQPGFRHLDCIDLVLENKLLLLVSWDATHAGKIRIRPGKAVYRKSSGAAIIKLPAGTEAIDIILYNTWRSTKTSIHLKKVTVDQATLHYINKHFLAGLGFSVLPIKSSTAIPDIHFNNLSPRPSQKIELPAFNITINHHQINDYVA